MFHFRTFIVYSYSMFYQTTKTMKVQTENIFAYTCVKGGCAAMIAAVFFLFMMLSDNLKNY